MAALRPGASPPPVRTPKRTTPSVIPLRCAAAARGQIEHEHGGAQGNDQHPENDTRGVVERVAADADDAFEKGGAQEEQNQSDVDPHELAGQEDGPDQHEQPAENHRLATLEARWLANGGSLAAGAAYGRCVGHAPTLPWQPLLSRVGAHP